MIPDYRLCDKCGAKTNTVGIFLEVGSHYDGVEWVPEGKYVDLCDKHLLSALKIAVSREWNWAQAVVKWISIKDGRRQ